LPVAQFRLSLRRPCLVQRLVSMSKEDFIFNS
jgi:hypothetical protein